MADYLSFREFFQEAAKAGQPVAPPKRPRSPKALVNVPRKRVKGAKKPTGVPLAPPSAEPIKESLKNPAPKGEKAVAIVVPQKTKIQKFLSQYRSRGRGSTHKSGYAHARRGSISAPARRASPKHLKMED